MLKKLDMRRTQDAVTAQRLVDNMVNAVPFDKRHEWLLDHGWYFSGFNAPLDGNQGLGYRSHGRANYYHPGINHPRMRSGGTCNQTFAMHVAAWDILKKKGITNDADPLY